MTIIIDQKDLRRQERKEELQSLAFALGLLLAGGFMLYQILYGL